MNNATDCITSVALLSMLLLAPATGGVRAAQDGKARGKKVEAALPENGVQREEFAALGVKEMRYILHGPLKKKPPKKGWKLAVILPGGGGGEDFKSFVGRILKNSLGDDYLVAQPISIEWTEGQFKSLVWPTKKNPAKKAKFTTEEFVDGVMKDIHKRHKIDREHRYLMGWSSSGPPTYTISLADKPWFTGYFVSQSVFYPAKYGSLKKAKGRVYWIDHGKEDEVCEFKFAEKARDDLKKNGAKVEFSEQPGGHGWTGMLYPRIAKGFKWLEKNHSRPQRR